MALDGGLLPSKQAGRWRLWPSEPLLLGLVVFLACLFGIYTRPVGFLATLWPANAIMLGFMLLRPSSARASGWLAAAVAYFAADYLTGSSFTKAALLNLANLVGVGTAFFICARLPADAIRLRQPDSMLYVALVSAAGAASAAAVGAAVNPILFGGGSISGSFFWFATEFVNYITILPVMLSWPGKLSWQLGKPTAGWATFDWAATDKAVASPAAYSSLPVVALVLSCVVSVVIGGPGAVAFPVPALLWCGLVYPVFPTAVVSLLFGCWALIAISAGYLPTSIGVADEMTLISIRLGASLITLTPVTLATVMQSRNELIDMLHRSRRRLDMALDAGGIVGTWALDIRAARPGSDNSLVGLLGMKPEKTHPGIDDMLSASVHPADRERVRSALKEAIASRSDYQCRFRLVTPRGETRWLIASGKPVGDGQAGQLAGIVIDVTEHAETEAALHHSNLRFHIVTESIPQIVWSTDADGNHDYYNHRWVEFTGVAVEAMGPETWKTLVHPDDWPVVEAEWRECLPSGKTLNVDYRLRHHDGTYRWVKVLAKPIRDTDGAITRWYGTSTDIDDAKHLELERELVAHELDHRIKNLFTLVNGLVSLSVREQPALRDLAEPLSARLNALHQAHGLIRGETGSRNGTLQALLGQLLKPYEAPGNISITGVDVSIDAGVFKAMALVLHELITNSAKYGALSQKEGRLHVNLHADEDRLTITWEERFSGDEQISGKSIVEEASGFGSKLIKTIIEMQLRGSLTQNLRKDGLTVIIDLPRSVVAVREHVKPEHSGQDGN